MNLWTNYDGRKVFDVEDYNWLIVWPDWFDTPHRTIIQIYPLHRNLIGSRWWSCSKKQVANNVQGFDSVSFRTHNCQKSEKVDSLYVPAIKFLLGYYVFPIILFYVCENLDNFVKSWYIVINRLIKVESKNPVHICDI